MADDAQFSSSANWADTSRLNEMVRFRRLFWNRTIVGVLQRSAAVVLVHGRVPSSIVMEADESDDIPSANHDGRR